ncbi:UNVERIFIED_CONTAM: hypothetical protein Slati_3725100, partial [Sesamum latifolium]
TDFSEKENSPTVQWIAGSQVAGDSELASLEQRPAAIANHVVARARCEQQPAATTRSGDHASQLYKGQRPRPQHQRPRPAYQRPRPASKLLRPWLATRDLRATDP